jgi:hypothetical protein
VEIAFDNGLTVGRGCIHARQKQDVRTFQMRPQWVERCGDNGDSQQARQWRSSQRRIPLPSLFIGGYRRNKDGGRESPSSRSFFSLPRPLP